MEYTQIAVDLDDGVATVTLDRPERMNAWTATMGLELSKALRWADESDEVRAVVLTGRGRAFCAGADLGSGGATFDDSSRPRDQISTPMTLPYEIRKPVIAAVNGHAIGVGITYPLCADVRFVAEEARVQFAFVRRGVIPELSSHVLLARVAGVSIAADLLLSGRQVSGREAFELGVASRALPAADVLAAAQDWARDVAVNTAPGSVALAKQLLWADVRPALEACGRAEGTLFAWAGRQADAHEGVSAFLEKRTPQWSVSVSRDLPAVAPFRT